MHQANLNPSMKNARNRHIKFSKYKCLKLYRVFGFSVRRHYSWHRGVNFENQGHLSTVFYQIEAVFK